LIKNGFFVFRIKSFSLASPQPLFSIGFVGPWRSPKDFTSLPRSRCSPHKGGNKEPLAFALYLFEVRAKPRQSRNPFRGIPPFRQSRNPVRGREERRILAFPFGERQGRSKILVRIEDSHPGKAKILVRTFGSHPRKATSYEAKRGTTGKATSKRYPFPL
jgi:hypothetical protein